MYQYYRDLLGYNERPEFINKYLNDPTLLRLKKVGYLCGMENASKDIYNFREYISRYDHSLTVALQTWKFTKNRIKTISGLYHDVATPCFSHVIDYMNKDYKAQESTEEKTEELLNNNEYLLSCLKEDCILVDDIIDFKKYSIVDNDRPKLCADRLDGIILTGIAWTKDITEKEIKLIVDNANIFQNEIGEDEIGFNNKLVAKYVLKVNNNIDKVCHSKEDCYMMELLAKITKRAIEIGLVSYDDLYILNEENMFDLLLRSEDPEIIRDYSKFRTITKEEIESIILPDIKVRKINPLVSGKRLIS